VKDSIVKVSLGSVLNLYITDNDLNTSPKGAGLRETGPNTNLFVVNIDVPRKIDSKTVQIGSTVEFRFIDTSSAASTSEIVKTTLRIGCSR